MSEPMASRRVEDVYPLSPIQEGLLFHSLYEPESSAYLTQVSFALEGLDPAAFEEAWRLLLERHAVLRTAFSWRSASRALQLVVRRVPLPIEHEDWRALAPVERDERFEARCRREAGRPFSLNRPPLMRLVLIRFAESTYRLIWTHHHLLLDGWSRPLLLRDFILLYRELKAGRTPFLPVPPPYRKFIEWLGGQDRERALDFWRRELGDLKGPTHLGVDRPLDPARRVPPQPREVKRRVDPATYHALEEVRREHGLTVGTFLLGAWALLLSRYGGKRDVVFGLTVSGRPAALPGVESMVGNFINTLPLRARIPAGGSTLAWLRDLQRLQVEMQEYDYLGLVEIQTASAVPRGTPLFETILFLQNYPLDAAAKVSGDGLGIGEVEVKESTDYPLILVAVPRGGLWLRSEYDARRFDRTVVRRILGHVESLLAGLVEDVLRPPDHRDLLSPSERQQVLREWNDTARPLDAGASVVRWIERSAGAAPDATAVVCGGDHLTYGELLSRVRAGAGWLRSRGLGSEGVVAFLCSRSPDLVTGMLATFAAGGAYLPLDPAHPPARIAQVLDRSRPRLVLAEAGTRSVLSRAVALLPAPRRPDVEDLPGPAAVLFAGTSPETPSGRALAYAIFTSGSTGLPKGAMVEHRGMDNHLLAKVEELGLGGTDRVAQNASQCFDISVWQFLAALVTGGTVEILDDEIARVPERLLDQAERRRITVVETVPSLLRALLDEVEARGSDRPALSALRWMIPTGEALPPEVAERWLSAYPAVPLLNAYGPTECSDDVTHHALGIPKPEGRAGVPIGQPVRNLRMYVLDLRLRPVPSGVTGELYVGGVGVGRGYLGEPRRTAGAFVPDLFSREPGARLYRTGDLGRALPGGELEFAGRVDHQVKLRGYRIELGEVEAVLSGLAGVKEAVVLAREDGEGDLRLVVYVVPSEGGGEAGARVGRKIGEWREVFDEVYDRGEVSEVDRGINLRVWIDSSTGAPLPETEIVECVEDSVARILALRPTRVLEIGCGTGLLLFRIAPHCEAYYGTDLSPRVLDELGRAVAAADLPHVHLFERSADDLSGVPAGTFDVVVLNEVAQYFPSAEYLAQVLMQAVRATAPGGAVFAGGLRNLALLEAFHTTVELARAPERLSLEGLRRRAARSRAGEKELLVDPELFQELRRREPRIRAVELQLKGGRSDNELTRYRYDVVLRIAAPSGESGEVPASEPPRQRWDRLGSLEALEQRLARDAPPVLRVEDIPNARLARDREVLEALASRNHLETVGELRAVASEAGGGVEPADLWVLGSRLGYSVHLGWASSGDRWHLDALFSRPGHAAVPGTADRPVDRQEAPRPWSRYGNDPLRALTADDLVPGLRSAAAERLPPYMVPEVFIVLDSLPLTATGKIDRRALPEPTRQRDELQQLFVEPANPVEEILAGIFEEVVGTDRVGGRDDFFALGGHSLNGTQVIARVRRALGVELPLRTLFESPTPAALARAVEEARPAGGQPPPPVEGDRGDGPPPLSFAQERLWFIDQLEPSGSAYNLPLYFRARGQLDRTAFRRTLSEIVRRHDVLRTSFPVVDGRPVQRIAPATPFPLPLVDLSGLPAAGASAEVARLGREEVRRGFDLAAGPLFRGSLVVLEPSVHQLLMNTHHIVFDGSFAIFARELVSLYGAFTSGRPSPLEEPPVQYGDFARWQREWLRGEVLDRLLAHWRDRLEGIPEILELPTDRPRPAVRSHRGANEPFALPRGLYQELRALSRRQGGTLFMTALAAFKLLLHRYSGQHDLPVGSPVLDRPAPETEGLVGCFVNSVVLRTRLDPGVTFDDLCSQVRETALDAYAHQELPFEVLVEALEPRRSLGHTPLFQTMFVLLDARTRAVDLELPGLALARPESQRTTARFDLLLGLWEGRDDLTGTLEYSTELFDATTVRRMLGQLQNLLHASVASPGRPVAELSMLGASERHHLLVEWNDTAVERERETTALRRIDATAAAMPDAVAVEGAGGERLSYGDLDRRARRLAALLCSQGAGRGTWVAVSLDRGPALVEGLLGVLRSGAAYVPLEPTYPAARVEWILASLGVRHVVTDSAGRERLDSLDYRPRLAHVNVISRAGGGAARPVAAAMPPPEPPAPEDLAYVIFTSGSTGTPKGVMVRHRPVTNLIDWVNDAFGVGPGDRLFFTTSPCFDLSVYDVFGVLAAGGTVRVASAGELAEPALLVDALGREPITLWDSAPAALQRLVPLFDRFVSAVPPALRLVLLSGDWIPLALPDRVRSSFPAARVVSLGGATEATVWSNVFPVGELDRDWVSIPYGRPIDNARYHVLDGNLEPCATVVPGDLYIAGACLSAGYAGDPAQTAGKFLPDPWSGRPGARRYATGDRARYRPDGNLEFLGRLDQQVKIRGHRIELGEIETVLARDPRVLDGAVVARGADREDKLLVAYVVPAGDRPPSGSELREALAGRLPEYMLPSVFVLLEALPTTANGKLDRRALPAPEQAAGSGEPETLRTPTQETLAEIWASVLGARRLGPQSDFFELGGHSLLATRILARVRETLGVDLPLRRLFESPKLGELASEIDNLAGAGSEPPLPPLTRGPRGQRAPLSFDQQRLWFLDQLEAPGAAYNVVQALRIGGDLDAPALAAALRRVVERHEILRTTFETAGGEPFQRVGPVPAHLLPMVDLGGLGGGAEAAAHRAALAAARAPFHLAEAPVLRTVLLRCRPDLHLLVVALHHTVADGASVGILARELGSAYRSELDGSAPEWPELPIQYADFARWQRRWMTGERIEALLDHWRRRLDGAPALLELPLDRSRPAVERHRGDSVPLRIDAGLVEALRGTGRRKGATLFMAGLAGFLALLYRTTGQADLVVGSPVANREQREVEPLIGLFVSTIVLRTDLRGDPSFAALLDRVREVYLEAHAHRHLPFERLVEAVAPERNLSHSPLFQVLFSLENRTLDPTRLVDRLRVERISLESGAAQFDLTLALTETAGGLEGGIEYNVDLFDRTTVLRLARGLTRLLGVATEDPARPLSRLSLLSPAERQQVVAEAWGPRGSGPEPPVHLRIRERAASQPHAVAVEGAGEALSYGELTRRMDHLASRLRQLGAGPELPVAVVLDRSPLMVVGLLGVMAAGAPYLPLDPAYPRHRLELMLEDSGCRVVVTERALSLGRLAGLLTTRAGGSGGGAEDEAPWSLVALDGPDDDRGGGGVGTPAAGLPRSLAYLIYTSGSTGRPKGVEIPHGALSSFLVSMARRPGLDADDVLLAVTSPSFDISALELFLPLWVGGRVVVASSEEAGDGERLGRALERRRATVVQATPATFRLLLAAGWAGAPDIRLLCGGEALPRALAGELSPRCREIWNLYGPTESTVWSAVRRVARDPAEVVPLGRPIRATRIRVLDSRGRAVPLGSCGELTIGGAGLARGYRGRPALTAERFGPDPAATSPGDRVYRTGDRGRLRADGDLEFGGRLDHQVKVRGFRIELGEVEAALAEHPGVHSAAARVARDAEGGAVLHAFVVPERDRPTVDAAELRSFLARRLPHYMVPAAIANVAALPLTPNGKVDRGALPRLDPAAETGTGSDRRPAGPVEQMVAEVWCRVLERDDVGSGDDFFELGGHSLLAARAVARLRDSVRAELELRDLFAFPRVDLLARRIEDLKRGTGAPPPLRRVDRAGPLALSFAQERLWFVHQVSPDSAAYNVPEAVRVEGELDLARLHRALSAVAARHEVLRTRFPAVDGRPSLVIAPPQTLGAPVVDLSGLDAHRGGLETRRLLGERARQPFDLESGPLLRVTLLLVPGASVVALTFHHIVVDAASVRLLVGELMRRYQGEEAPGEPVLQYVDFAAWQRGWLRDEVLERLLAHWGTRLANPPASLALPFDRERTATGPARGQDEPVRVPPEVYEGLKRVAREEGATPFMSLFAAYAVLLARYGGTDDLLIGTFAGHRDRPEVEGMVGLFVNSLVLRVDLSDEPTFRDLVVRVRDVVIEAFTHGELPYERLVAHLRSQGELERLEHEGLFQVSFNFEAGAKEGQGLPPGLSFSAVGVERRAAQEDISLVLAERDGGVAGALRYDARLFDRATMRRMADHFNHLLAASVAEPGARVSALSLAGPDERVHTELSAGGFF